MNKDIKKEIMKRSSLRNKFLNTKSAIDRKAYNKQRNLCVSLIRSERRTSLVILTDNKTFWKTVKPFLTNEIKTKSKIKLISKKYCLPGRSTGNSFRKNNCRRSGQVFCQYCSKLENIY